MLSFAIVYAHRLWTVSSNVLHRVASVSRGWFIRSTRDSTLYSCWSWEGTDGSASSSNIWDVSLKSCKSCTWWCHDDGGLCKNLVNLVPAVPAGVKHYNLRHHPYERGLVSYCIRSVVDTGWRDPLGLGGELILSLEVYTALISHFFRFLPHFRRVFPNFCRTLAAFFHVLAALWPRFSVFWPHFGRVFPCFRQVRCRTIWP